jgi:CheY-like chemotaxis protein
MSKRISITDDDPGVQDIFKMIFETAGYEVTVYHNGKELLESGGAYPDVYLLDKQLSGMDGLDICRLLKNDKRTRDIPVIMVSATPGLAALSKEAGADDFIEKPFRKNDLLDMVAKHIEESLHNDLHVH